MSHLDNEYYEMRIGIEGTTALWSAIHLSWGDQRRITDSLNDSVSALQELSRAHAKFQPRRAAILSFLLQVMAIALHDPEHARTNVRGLVPNALDLVHRYRDEFDAYQLALAAAVLDPDLQRAKDAVGRVPSASPSDAPQLYLRRARVQLTLAAMWRDLDVARAVLPLLAVVPPDTEPAIVAHANADALAMIALLTKEKEAASRAAEGYAAIQLPRPDARLFNNQGVVLMFAGEAGDARKAFERASALKSGKDWIPQLNLAVLSASEGEVAGAIAVLDQLANACRTEDQHVPLPLTTWRAVLTKRAGKPVPASLMPDTMIDIDFRRKQLLWPEATIGGDGPELSGTLTLNASISQTRRRPAVYELDLTILGAPWLLLPYR
jgi:hypothetical protein